MPSPPPADPTDAALIRLVEAVAATGYAFVTPTPASHARVLGREPGSRSRSLRDVFGWSLPFEDGVIPGEIKALMGEAGVLVEAADGFRSAVRLSTLDGMLFLHSAYPTAGADAVFFGPDTYRFARAIRQFGGARVGRAVDVCCGAGPGAAVIARSWPGAEVYGVDINPVALHFARVNAAVAGFAARFVDSDLLTGLEGSFDLIVANPPYLVDPGERTYRHGGGRLGAGLSLKILDAAVDRLAAGGTLLLYTGAAIVGGDDAFARDAQSSLAGKNVSWTYDEIDPDVFGDELQEDVYAAADRIAAVLLTATRKANR